MTPEEISQERSKRLRSAFLDQEFGGAKALMDDSAFGGVVEDKEAFLTSSAVAGWAGVALNRRVNPASPEWQGIKDGIARGYFKNQAASNVSDGDMFGMIAADYQAQDKIANASRIAAARGESWLGKFREVETANAGSMIPGRMTNYLGLARAAHDEMAAKVAPYRSTIKTVADMARNIDTAPDGMDWGAMASELVKVPKEDRPYVIEALSLQTPGESKSEDGERIKLAFLRGMERYIDTASTSLLGSSMADIEASARDNPLLTPAQSGEVLSASSSVADFLDLRDDMRDIATGKLAPLNAVKFAGMNIAGAAENIPMTLGSFIPYLGAAVTLGSFQRSTYNEVRRNNPTMSRDAANAIATISAPFQAVTEIASDRFLFGRLPNLKRAFTQPIFSTTGALAMFTTRAAIGTATEVGEEFAQGVTPLAVQSISRALGEDLPGSDWEGFLGEFAQNMPELISTILPLAIVGAGAGQLSDFRAGRQMARSTDMLIAAKFSPESAAKISKLANAGKWSEAEDAMRGDWAKINAKGDNVSQVKATAEQRLQAAERLKGLQKEQVSAEGLQTTSPDYTVNVTRSPSGWQVQTGSGTVLTVESAEAARRIAVDLRQVGSQQEADTLVGVIDGYYEQGKKAETVFTGETVQASNVEAVGVVATRRDAGNVVLSQRQIGPQALETVRAEAEVAGIKTGTQGIFAHINGSNEVFPMRVADGAKEIVRRMNLYKSQAEGQPQVITFLHENFESTWRLGMANGTFSNQETRTAMRALLPAFEGVTALNAEEAQFINNLRTLANDQGNETMLRETVSEMVIRDVLGRDRQGRATGMKPGSISRAIEASVMGANTQEEVSALKSILAAIKAFTAYLKGVFGTVDAITKARDEGKLGEEYDTFINKVIGIDEVKQMESQAVEEGKSMLGVDAETQAVIDADNMPFSISAVTPAQDAEYLAAVERGDMAEAQAMVDEATRAADVTYLRRVPIADIVYSKLPGVNRKLRDGDAKPIILERTGRNGESLALVDGYHRLDGMIDYGEKEVTAIILNSSDAEALANNSPREIDRVQDEHEGESADPVTRDESGQVIPLSERFNEASPDIRFSISPIPENERITPENKVATSINGKPAANIFEEVKKRHGVTRSIYEAGYVLPDGTMLDFSGRADAGGFTQGADLVFRAQGRDYMKDQRGVDHREIEWQDMPEYKETWEPMAAFLRLGAVRVDANSGMISMHSRAKITSAQASALKSIVIAADGAYIDLEDDAKNRSSMQLDGGKWGKVNGLLTRWANGETPEFEGVTYSISPIRNLNELSDQVERQFKENPAGALEVKSKVIRQFAKLADKWSNERWTPQGNKIRPISEKRTVKSLDKEQAMRQAQREVELVNEGMDKLTPDTLMAYSEGVGTLEDDPLVKEMLHNNGRLMSKATAEREGRNIKDQYDDLNWIPPQWYSNGRTIKTVVITRKDGSSESFPSAKVPAEIKAAIKSGEVKVKINKVTIPAVGGIMPDVMANNLGFDTASEMWAALESSIKSHRAAKAGYAKAEDAVKAVERAAFEQARKEAQAWRTETDAMQKEDWSPRESLVRDLITLEAIVAMFPQEIRGKIGGFVALARKASESARLKVLQKQLERGQVLLEKHLKEQYGEAVDKLFDKYRPERKAGEKPKGKLDPDAQEIADKSESAMGFNSDQVNAEIASINTLLDADNISAEDEAKLEAMRELVQLLGDWKNADSARRESAFIALNDVLTEGWAKWKMKQILKREQREEMRKLLKSATGKKGVAIERDKMKIEAAKVLGKAARWMLNLSSFGEVMTAVFGAKVSRQFIDNERNASNQYEDAIQDFSERIDEFFTTLTGGVLRGERLRFDLAQPSLTIGAGGMNERNISQLQGIQALLMWQQEDGRRHMEGPRDENGAAIEGKWSYDQAWIDELTGKLSPEAVEVKKFIEQLYSEEWVPLNAVYRERHGVNLPRHDKYATITVTPQQAKLGEMVDPVSGAAIAGSILTPGSLRSRNRSALAEPEFRDALSTFIAHTKQMEHWKAYYDIAVEMQSVLGNRDVANSVKAAVGDEGVTVLKKWIDVFAQGGTRDAAAGLAVSDGLGRLSGRVATVGLLGRFSTLLVQSTQLAAASVRMPTGAYLKRFALLMSGNLQWRDAINSEFIQRRIKSAPPLIRQAMQNIGEATKPNQIQRVTRHLGQLLSGADGLFTAGTYAILLDYHRTMGAKMGMEGEALESYAHAEAVNATEQVAQPVRTGTRSIIEVTYTNPVAKMSWAYASEARQKVALFAWSAYNAKNDPAGAAKTAFLVFVIGGLMSQVLKNLWREAKGDDDEKKWSPERLTMAALSPITSAIPGAGMIAGEGGSLSGAQYVEQSVKDVFTGKMDMKDADTILSFFGYFNDTIGGIATLSHAGYDFAKVLENAFGEE